MRENEDFLVMHQMNEFTTGKPCAMLVIRLNKQAFTKAIEKDLEQGFEYRRITIEEVQ